MRKPAIPLCGFLLLVVSDCGGGGGGGTAQPLTAESLYCFGSSATDAIEPDGGLLQATDGNFYGTTIFGGIGGGLGNDGPTGNGTVYKITPTGEETVLHLFAAYPVDGQFPNSLIQGTDGNLYGTTSAGGTIGGGTVFRLSLEGVETILYNFGSDGFVTGLIQGSDGNFYGGTDSGVAGIVFKMTPTGVLTTLATFPGSGGPTGGLLEGSDGNLYGTTGADTSGGTVFKLTPEGVETVLHSFAGFPTDGADPNGPLIQDGDGNLYDTTVGGGANGKIDNGWGTVFKITPEGVETILHSFANQSDGAYPSAGLIQGSDGNFYGVTSNGGSNYSGTIFKIAPTGTFSSLYTFPPAPAGNEPGTHLVQGSDGNLYGTTALGGPNGAGCFFRFVLK